MEPQDVVLGLPVANVSHAKQWYLRVFELGEPDLEPIDGVAEFKFGPVWLQLLQGDTARSGAQVTPSFGVPDVRAERDRLVALGLDVGPVVHVEGAVDYLEFTDPDGNLLSLHSEAS